MTYCDIFWVVQLINFYFGERRAFRIFIKIIADIWDSFIGSFIQNWLSRPCAFIIQTLY